MSEVNLDAPLLKLKDEIDDLDLKIVGCDDEMKSLREYKEKYFEFKTRKKELAGKKRILVKNLKIISDFYKQATGEEPDGIYPLFSNAAEG